MAAPAAVCSIPRLNGGLQLLDGAYAYNTTVNSGGELHVTGGNIIETYYNAGQSYGSDCQLGRPGTRRIEPTPGRGGSAYWGISNGTTVNTGGDRGSPYRWRSDQHHR